MSDLGSLSQCMLESDAEGLSASRVLRRKALTLSVAFEAAVLSLLIVGPLLFPGVLPSVLSRTPVPPYHRGVAEVFVRNEPHGTSAPNSSPHPVMNLLIQQPPNIPSHVFDGAIPEVAPPASSTDGTPGVAFGDPNGPNIPGIDGHQRLPELKPPPAKSTQPIKVSQGVMEAALVTQIRPVYPPPAVMMRLSGDVVLHAIVGKDGSVRQLQVLSGNPILVQAALAAVRQWRYHPTMLSGEPVDVDTTITVRFVLGSE
jgi:periplasmic protein TonB